MTETGGSVAPVAVTGLGAVSAFGRGTRPLAEAVAAGRPGFAPVSRFDVTRRATVHAAALPGDPRLADELISVIEDACRQSGLRPRDAADVPLLLGLHADPQTAPVAARVAQGISQRCGLAGITRTYTCACVAGSTAVAHAASLIGSGAAERVVVAAGYLVEPDMFAVFDAGRALTRGGRPRPFSRGRDGLLLGDAVVAVVLESTASARKRDADVLATVAGWGRSGDAYHVCRPIPDGSGLARAIEDALGRAGVGPAQVGYVNANASGSQLGDGAEAAALRRVFGDGPGLPAVSSTKSVHGHALEASALLEFAVTVLALRDRILPVNAGYLGPDEDCRLDLVLDGPRPADTGYALSVNSAFGGANTALLVGAA
ncbi:MAG TPA: beta-ketoacyl synthase N-terminal-like domain-containing protein [Actinocrinis sp.]|uniref:beta-ketoacyl-[acyl-carrier-protein] synthase family protein n=1 Tax=Actinocrinis sp. TaxID=1920516 RepID=UPI002DDDAB7F|nr:beta-ketoacyl synthase N-terminal-like domain-containing protein [Actinocrinis sp.]HEV2343406.1 beta-ketoacyl synthase N-terminal-like domain-containing protein [Actinocrinis sp.]